MKSIAKNWLLAACAILFCTACSIPDLVKKGDNYGYPTNVTIPAEGGTVTIFGDGHIYSLTLSNYYGEIRGMETNGQFFFQSEWFLATFHLDHSELSFTAEPNTTSEPRSAILELWLNEYDGYYATVNVVQEAAE